MRKGSVYLLCCSLLITLSCNKTDVKNRPVSNAFSNYWYKGEAELNRYELKQSRYGEIREGDAVLIFVTEDFLTGRQVKFEGHSPGKNRTSVLKLNFTRNFTTGIYPYSMMSSVFTPITTESPALKVTTSSQEWCGHTYTQLNYHYGAYDGTLHSYFEQEADQSVIVRGKMLEDNLWNQIRLDPAGLPIGEINILPGTQFLRLKHFPLQQQPATATIDNLGISGGKLLRKFSVEYHEIPRKLEIVFESDFPYGITEWSEIDTSNPAHITTARRTHTYKAPYWQQNSVADSVYRQKLGL